VLSSEKKVIIHRASHQVEGKMEHIEPNSKIAQAVTETIENAPYLQETGESVGKAVVSVANISPITREVADFLHGVWLGHPLHAVLTDLTIGAWTTGAILDTASMLIDSEEIEQAADLVTGIGTVSAIGTAITGLNDYSRIKRDAVKPGMLHGLLNMAAFTSYVISMAARRSGNRKVGLTASMTGLGISMLSAWIGGDMVYRHQVGVNHAVPPGKKLAAWTPVLADSDLAEKQALRVEVDGTPILLYRRWGIVLAMGAVCSHAGGPLEQGTFEGSCVECPWHQSVFDLRDGSVVHGPATMQEPSFEARVNEGQIEVRIHPADAS
jgi:nitrite reductase/ring-hydroxylating ferredoxin subunit/uncharacterized membrane protein